MNIAHKIRLYPNKEQGKVLAKACGCARFTYNWALAEWSKQYEAGGKPTGSAVKRYFNSIKRKQFPWIYDSPKDANQQPFSDLQYAFNKFFSKQAGHPKFKKKGVHDSFYVSNDQAKITGNYIRLPRIGMIKLAEPLRFEGKIMSYTVSRTANQWYVSVTVEMLEYHKDRTADGTVGVDLGIKSLLTCSNGTVLDSLAPLKHNLKQLQRLSRRHSRKKPGSNNRKKSALKLARLHRRIACKRKDVLHKATTQLCRENQTIVIEDLNVVGMLKDHMLARAISDAGFGEFRRQLTYKSLIYGTTLVVANRFFPSSKQCSRCGNVKQELKLAERTYHCAECGHTQDRDLNAANNLRTLGYRGTGLRPDACGQESAGGVALNTVQLCLVEAGTIFSYQQKSKSPERRFPGQSTQKGGLTQSNR